MVFFNAIFCSSLYIVLRRFWYNFTSKDVYFTRLEFDYLRIGKDIGKSWEERSDKIDRLRFELVVIKNLAISSWYPWADKASSHWCYAYFFFYCKERRKSYKNSVL